MERYRSHTSLVYVLISWTDSIVTEPPAVYEIVYCYLGWHIYYFCLNIILRSTRLMLFVSPTPNNYINFIKSQWITFICLHLFFHHQIHKAYVILTFKWIITFAVVIARHRRVRTNSQTENFRTYFGDRLCHPLEERQSIQPTETAPQVLCSLFPHPLFSKDCFLVLREDRITRCFWRLLWQELILESRSIHSQSWCLQSTSLPALLFGSTAVSEAVPTLPVSSLSHCFGLSSKGHRN